VQALLAALAARGLNPQEQSEQMIALARAVARRMALTEEQVEMVAEVALLHDVGKIGMPDSLLHKQDELD
jgi:response regulator RpfG family c-di-GMP phosphodiesterase